jgi:hypothetical protein
MLGGLIAGALKGAAEGYQTYAKGEMENQQKLDYQTKLTQLLEEKERRVEEWKAKVLPGMQAEGKLTAAPIEGKAGAARTKAETEAMIEGGVPELQAQLEDKKYTANRPLAERKAKDTGTDAATAQVSKVGTEGYIDSVAKEDEAKSAGNLAEQRLRNQGGVEREQAKPPRSGRGGSDSDSSIDLERRFKAANRNLAQQLGVADGKVSEELAYLKRKADSGDQKAVKRYQDVLPAVKDWQDANTALRNFTRKNPSGSSSSGDRPPLASFNQ